MTNVQEPDSDATVPEPADTDDEIITRLLEGRDYSETVTFDTDYGTIDLELSPIFDRRERYDYLKRLPSGWFEAGQKDDPSEVEDFGSLIPDGDGIGALEEMAIQSASSNTLTQTDIENFVRKILTDDAVTRLGLKVVQMSADLGAVDDFR